MNPVSMLDHRHAPGIDMPRVASTPREDPIPFGRLVKVELRKSFDTRSGRWLLGAITGGTALVMALMVVVGIIDDQAFGLTDFMQAANFLPMGLLLPVLGVLSVTGEWGQRTNMVTFTLEPRRSRIAAAKLSTGVLMALGAAVIAPTVGIVSLAAFDLAGGAASWEFSAQALGGFALLQLIGVLTGFAFGMLVLNTPAAIVSYFAFSFLLPTVFMGAASLWRWAESLRPWIDFDYVQEPMLNGTLDVDWRQFATTTALWFVMPVVLGARRLVRAEIK